MAMLDEEPQQLEESFPEKAKEGEESSIAAGCLPCALGHYGTCSSLLSEGMRFARSDGIESNVPLDRINKCLDELNTMERDDLMESKIIKLPPWEKTIADKTLIASRKTRHALEGIRTTEDLERVTADTQVLRTEIGREWFKEKIARMNPQEKKELAKKAVKQIEEESNAGTARKTTV